MSSTKTKLIGNLLLVLCSGWVYMIDDFKYVALKKKDDYDKLKDEQKDEHEIYKDESYPLLRRALAKARVSILSKRIPKEKRYEELRTKSQKEQAEISDF